VAIKWNNIENVFNDYLVSLNEENTKGIISKIVENIHAISEFSDEFYIGRTGDPEQRLVGGTLSQNVESLHHGHHSETGYDCLWLLLNSKNKALVELVEESLLEIFYKYPNNANTSRSSSRQIKNSGDYFIYVATKLDPKSYSDAKNRRQQTSSHPQEK
jgi:hypothetical protein